MDGKWEHDKFGRAPSPRRGPQRVSQRRFMNLVTNDGRRGFIHADQIEFGQNNRNTQPYQSMTVTHQRARGARRASVTELHMHGEDVGSAYHTDRHGNEYQLHPNRMTDGHIEDNHKYVFNNMDPKR